MATLTAQQRDQLTGLAATIAFPDDPAYAGLVGAWNLAVTSAPLAAIAVTDAGEVARVVGFAAANGIPVAVRCTGHGATDDLTGAILVSTRGLDEVTIHADERWARVGAGVSWRSVLEAAAPHGLAALAGSSPGVGVVGYTTGGGHGPIARTYGLASDRVRAFDVVTGDGTLRRVTATEHPELFWGLRGGKGALGIVTAIEFDLLPIPTLYGGSIHYDGADAATLLRAWAAWCPTLPPEATTSIALLQLPAMPGVPEPLAGKTTVALRFAWTGDPESGARALAPMREAATPLMDGVAVMPYVALGAIHRDPVDPVPFHEGHASLAGFPAEAVEALLGVAGPGSGSPQVVVEVRQLGGALAAEPAIPSAFSHRDVAYSLYCVGIAAGPGAEAVIAHERAITAAMAPWSMKWALPNFAAGGDATRFARVFPPDVLVRLAGIAREHDPEGILVDGRGLR